MSTERDDSSLLLPDGDGYDATLDLLDQQPTPLEGLK